MDNPVRQSRTGWRQKARNFFLDLDSWIDSSLYESRFGAGEFWEDLTIFFRRFRVRGGTRAFFELASEGLTLGLGGMVVMLALALPAFEETETDWRTQDDFAVVFLDRYGNEIGRRGILHSDAVPMEELPDHLIKAVLATEDRRFFNHWGIDFLGLARAMTENVKANSVVQGGSTITQQLAKNLFLSNERTIERKVKEAFLSLWLEANMSKKEILKLYLDRAYMGGGTFGIAAASEFYFRKDVRDVSLAESAMLAGLFKAPAKYAPHVNLPAARGRANEVLTNMVQAGFLTEGQVTAARIEPADVVNRETAESPDYFLDWAFDEVKAQSSGLGTRSLIVRTTLDQGIQKAAEEAVEFHLRQYGKDYGVGEAAVVMLENNGAVRAIVGGRDYGASQFNRATRALRQAGSSFKPYVYAAALEAGLTPDSKVVDAPITWRGWSPQNYSRGFAGSMTATAALVKSINTIPVRLARDMLKGTEPIAQMAERLGVTSDIIRHHTMVLGTSGMTVMDQATAYLCFANGGIGGTRHAFTQLMSMGGEVLYDRRTDTTQPRQVIAESTAIAMNQMLAQVPIWGTARRAALPMTAAAGKTGTTQAYRDAWFVGYTGNYTAAVWFGNDDFTGTKELTGGRLPAMTWQRFMAYAHQGIDIRPLPGVDQPAPTDTPAVEPAPGSEADGQPVADLRPQVLTVATSAVLDEIRKAFATARELDGKPVADLGSTSAIAN